jgi:hypothetical protein
VLAAAERMIESGFTISFQCVRGSSADELGSPAEAAGILIALLAIAPSALARPQMQMNMDGKASSFVETIEIRADRRLVYRRGIHAIEGGERR